MPTPASLIGYDYVVDGNSSQGCSDWSYTNVTRQSQAGGLCGLFSNTYAKFAEALGTDKVVHVVYIPNTGEPRCPHRGPRRRRRKLLLENQRRRADAGALTGIRGAAAVVSRRPSDT